MWRVKAISLYLLCAVGFLGTAGLASADPPDILKSYKFLPHLSTLRETGGFAGVDQRYPVFGTYDFVTGYRYEPRIPADAMLTPYAQFTNVNAYGAHPAMDPGLSLEAIFNLSGLDGKPIYQSPSGLELFHFEGQVGHDDAPTQVHLLAARLGRWMYVRGETDAPCCDYFEYDLRAVAHQVPYSDWTDDGNVDVADLGQWQASYGAEMSGREFLEWQRQYGDQAPDVASFDAMMNDALAAFSAGATVASVAVPEPTGACMLTIAVMCSCTGRRYPL